jgi:hypothetical protein
MVGFCSHRADGADGDGRTITLNVPAHHRKPAGRQRRAGPEMIHQFLFERGEDPKHASAGWRREIMRLNKLIAGSEIWCGRSKTTRVDIGAGVKQVVRMNVAEPGTGRPSLTPGEIARGAAVCWDQVGRVGF